MKTKNRPKAPTIIPSIEPLSQPAAEFTLAPWATSQIPELAVYPGVSNANEHAIARPAERSEVSGLGLEVHALASTTLACYLRLAVEGVAGMDHLGTAAAAMFGIVDLRNALAAFRPDAHLEAAQLAVRHAEIAIWLLEAARAGRLPRKTARMALRTKSGIHDVAVAALKSALVDFADLGHTEEPDALTARVLLTGLVGDSPVDFTASGPCARPKAI